MTTGWGVRTAPEFDTAIKEVDGSTAQVILAALEEVADSGGPRWRGKALTGGQAWILAVPGGDYRSIGHIVGEMVIGAIDVGHRSTMD